jgi:CRP-like cAMP-binding protein
MDAPLSPAFDAGVTRSNRLLRFLPEVERQRLSPHLVFRHVRHRQILYKSGQTIDEVFFPENVICSIVCTMDNGASMGVAMTGPEGMIGIGSLIGATETLGDVVSHSVGSGHSLSVDVFQRELNRCGTFHALINTYSQECLSAAMQSVACNALHSAGERTARWLLMMADRSGDEDCRVTHDELALMLGLRRPTVTIAVGRLTETGTLMPLRGGIRIADRGALEAAACECWRTEVADREPSSSDDAPSIVALPSVVMQTRA